jgi:hypothetical protein
MMDRLAKWLLPLLLVIEVTLVPSGRLDISATVDIPAVINSLTCLLLARQVYMMRQQFRHARSAGQGTSGAIHEAIAVVAPRALAGRLVLSLKRQPAEAPRPHTHGDTVPLKLPQSG